MSMANLMGQVCKLLLSASWDYSYCGNMPDPEIMDSYLEVIHSNTTELVIMHCFLEQINEIERDNLDAKGAAGLVATNIANSLVTCIYDNVTFFPNL